MEQRKIDILIIKLFEQRLSKQETIMLEKWLKEKQNQAHFNEFVEINHLLNTEIHFDYHHPLQKIKLHILQAKRKKQLNKSLKYAAILIVLLGIGLFYFLPKLSIAPRSEVVKKETPSIINNEIEIGHNQAVLTLADGVEVALNKEKEYKQEHFRSNSEGLIYNQQASTNKEELKYNYLTVPRGGQFSIQLSDSTKVWLNSDSKLKYPVEFIRGQPRQIELLYGEAYFEVSPSDQHHGDRFIVLVNDLEVKALGTAFNIKAYQDESNTYTTLAEGTVELANLAYKVTLEPYQQASTNPNSDKIAVKTLSSLNELLWRKGEFSFKRKSLKDIMKVLSRWYDMDVVFNSPELEKLEFTGVLGKELSIEEIMIIIRQTYPINYEINRKTLTIE